MRSGVESILLFVVVTGCELNSSESCQTRHNYNQDAQLVTAIE